METRLLFAVMRLEQAADPSGWLWADRKAPSVPHILLDTTHLPGYALNMVGMLIPLIGRRPLAKEAVAWSLPYERIVPLGLTARMIAGTVPIGFGTPRGPVRVDAL
jgi:hypothetical protein